MTIFKGQPIPGQYTVSIRWSLLFKQCCGAATFLDGSGRSRSRNRQKSAAPYGSGSRNKNFLFLAVKKLKCTIMFWIIIHIYLFKLSWIHTKYKKRLLFFAFLKDTAGAALKVGSCSRLRPIRNTGFKQNSVSYDLASTGSCRFSLRSVAGAGSEPCLVVYRYPVFFPTLWSAPNPAPSFEINKTTFKNNFHIFTIYRY